MALLPLIFAVFSAYAQRPVTTESIVNPLQFVPEDCGMRVQCAEELKIAQPLWQIQPENFKKVPGNLEFKNPKRMARLRKEVVKRATKIFLKGRAPSQLSSDEKKVLASISEAEGFDSQGLGCGISCIMGGAAYAMGKQICICPVLENYSDEFIIFILGHEVGHLGDICAFDDTGLAPGEHPYEKTGGQGSVLNCLERNGIEAGASGEVLRLLTGAEQSADPWYEWATDGKAPDDLRRWTRNHVHCFSGKTSSKMREASADVVGFEILADYLKEHPLKKHPNNFKRLFGIFWERACRGSSAEDKRRQSENGHPADLDRITKIAMSIPAIRNVLSCAEPTRDLNCEYQPPNAATPLVNQPKSVK